MSTSPPQTTPAAPHIRANVTEQTGIHWSTIYLHTVPGTLKCVCMIFTFLGFICCTISAYGGYGRVQFFSTVAAISFWFTGILLILYLFHAVYVFYKIPWIKIEFFFNFGATLVLLLASALLAANGTGWLIAAAFFGFVAMCAYGYDTLLKYRSYNDVVKNAVTRTTTLTVA